MQRLFIHHDYRKTMREIKFRGYQPATKKWIYGGGVRSDYERIYQQHPLDEEACWCIIVDPASVGQYTGKCDRLQCEVYEDDIVRDELGSIGVVIFMEGMFAVDFGEGIELQELNTGILEVCEIIGNRFDNPELLK